METTRFEPGDVVYLAMEIETGGRIHEIGSRAVVRAATDSTLELAFGAAASGTVRCPAHRVVRAAERRARPRTPTGRWQLRLGVVARVSPAA